MKNLILVGYTATEELIARWLLSEGYVKKIIGLLDYPNDAIRNICFETNSASIKTISNYMKNQDDNYFYIGPADSCRKYCDYLHNKNYPFIGSLAKHLYFEFNRHKLFSSMKERDLFPKSFVLDNPDFKLINSFIKKIQKPLVFKYIGDYKKILQTTHIMNSKYLDLSTKNFICNCLKFSGEVFIQEYIVGKEFSATYLVDAAGHFVRLGENICYKRRFENNQGFLTDGIGSICINGSLPFLNSHDKIHIDEFINRVLDQIYKLTNTRFRGFLNLDLIKKPSGKLVILEVNFREPGPNTFISLYGCANYKLTELFHRYFQNKLNTFKVTFHNQTSIVVATFPEYFNPTAEPNRTSIISIKNTRARANIYYGRVQEIGSSFLEKKYILFNAPNFYFHSVGKNKQQARDKVYSLLNTFSNNVVNYRKDIGVFYSNT